ncbi:MAG: bile acid:sodium symporter [Neisseria sp.]|nr:bile acid:sodium symporter [Neisseria sp.]
MWKILSLLQKNLIWAIPITMLLALVGGYAFDLSFLQAAIIPLTFLMVYPMMVNLQMEQIFSKDDLPAQITAQLINFALIPLIAYALGKWFFPESPAAVLGLLLAALLPTSGMTISWTGFARGNLNAAIKMTVIGLILGSLATPFYTQWLLGKSIAIPMGKIFMSIAVVVFLPMVAGYFTKRFLVGQYGKEHYRQHLAPKFPPLSTLGVLGIVFVAIALKAHDIIANPAVMLRYLLPLLLLYVLNFTISTLIGKWFFPRGDAIAIVYGTVMRNLSIALAIAMTAFAEHGAEIAVIIALAYIIQVQAAAWYVRLTDKIFGPA